MIKLLIAASFLLLVFNCCEEAPSLSEQESISSEAMDRMESACGTTELAWLQEIIEKAEEDKQSRIYQGNFMGAIYRESYQGKVVIFVRMPMGSGGLYGYFYHCDGSQVDFSDDDPHEVELFFQSIEKGPAVYKNIPYY